MVFAMAQIKKSTAMLKSATNLEKVIVKGESVFILKICNILHLFIRKFIFV